MPNAGERWDKVAGTEKEVKQLRGDIKKADRKVNFGIGIAVAALVIPVLIELFKVL
jgi:hypothetical protein